MGSIFATSGHLRIALKKLANWFSCAERYYKIINKQILLVLMKKKHSDGLLNFDYFDISSVKFLQKSFFLHQKMSQIKSISKKCE